MALRVLCISVFAVSALPSRKECQHTGALLLQHKTSLSNASLEPCVDGTPSQDCPVCAANSDNSLLEFRDAPSDWPVSPTAEGWVMRPNTGCKYCRNPGHTGAFWESSKGGIFGRYGGTLRQCLDLAISRNHRYISYLSQSSWVNCLTSSTCSEYTCACCSPETGYHRAIWELVDETSVEVIPNASSYFANVSEPTNQACRGASHTDNNHEYYEVASATNHEDCMQKCLQMKPSGRCKGIEWGANHGNRCELWTRPEGIGATSGVPNFMCQRNLRAKVFMYLYQGEGNKACRGAHGNDNNAGYYVVKSAYSLRECQFKCSQREECRGIEYSMGRCEIWHRDGGIQAVKHIDESRGKFTCMKYEYLAPLELL